MKLDRKQQINTSYEATTEDVEMTLDESSSAMLMSSLTYLYGTPVLAALREYTANAMDETSDPTKTPVEIDFPFMFLGKQCLRVKDYGQGMNVEDLKDIYSKYGASTRRENNQKRGGFGLGSKSGLAVSDHFHIRTIKDGVQTQAMILKDNRKNSSYLRVEETKPTNLENGTEILIPVTSAQLESLTAEATQELSGYHPETYFLNRLRNTETVHNTDKWLPVALPEDEPVGWFKFNEIAETILKPNTDEDLRRKISVVMGGVFYPELPKRSSINTSPETDEIFTQVKELLLNTDHIVLNVPIGSVSLPPHRDALIDDVVTWKTLTASLQNFLDVFRYCIQNHVDRLPYKDAMKVIADHPNILLKVYPNPTPPPQQQPFRAPAPLAEPVKVTYQHQGKQYMATVELSETKEAVYVSNPTRWSTRVYTQRLKGASTVVGLGGKHAHSYNYAETVEGYVSSLPKSVTAYSTPQPRKNQKVHNILITGIEGFNQLHNTDPEKARKRAHSIYNTYVAKHLQKKFGNPQPWTTVFYVENSTVPHIAALVDETFTLEALQAKVRADRTAVPRTAVTQVHLSLQADGSSEPREVDNTTVMTVFGGKDSVRSTVLYRNAVPDTELGEKAKDYAARGTRIKNFPMFMGGIKSLLPYTELIMVDLNRSYGKFLKDFPEAKSLYDTVADQYQKLSEDEKELVYQAFTINRIWGSPEQLMVHLKTVKVTQPVFKGLIDNPVLYAIGTLLASFADPAKEDSSYNKLAEKMMQRIAADTHSAGFVGLPVFISYKTSFRNITPSYVTNTWYQDHLVEHINNLQIRNEEH